MPPGKNRFGSPQFPENQRTPLDTTLTYQGVNLRLQSDNSGSINQLTLTPSGLEVSNKPLTVEIDGTDKPACVAESVLRIVF